MDTLIWILFFPLAWPFIAQRIWHTNITYLEMGIQVVSVTIITSIVWAIGSWAATVDTEVWNGEIVKKLRDHGTYTQSYDCFCSESCSGSGSSRSCSTTCQTCYEDHYTVDWRAETTVGNFTFKSLDSTSKRVYNTPDPKNYKQCYKGQPASIEHNYTNYVQAAPDSLFHSNEAITKQFADKIPQKPRVYDHYKYTRVLNYGVLDKKQQTLLEEMLDVALISMGASKQVNIIVIFTKIKDQNFRFAVENAWQGGEKNDVVVFIGANADNTIAWADVMTWALNSGNELLQVELRNELLDIPTIDATTVGQTIIQLVNDGYIRPKMENYEYLESSSTPPTWAIIIALMFAFGGSIGLTWVFYVYDISFNHGSITIRKSNNIKRRYR
jgi:hypothetical protein